MLSLEEFVDQWWVINGSKLKDNELAKNGQFDELPYYEYEEVYLKGKA